MSLKNKKSYLLHVVLKKLVVKPYGRNIELVSHLSKVTASFYGHFSIRLYRLLVNIDIDSFVCNCNLN